MPSICSEASVPSCRNSMQLHLRCLMTAVGNGLAGILPCRARQRSDPIIEEFKFESKSEDTTRISGVSKQYLLVQSSGKSTFADNTAPSSPELSHMSHSFRRNDREQRDEQCLSLMPRYDIWSMADHQQSFCKGNILVSDGHLVPSSERFALVRLALAASEQDQYPRYMFQGTDPQHVLHIMRHMHDKWVEDKDTIMYVAKVASKETLSDPVGWICCSKIRPKDNTKRKFEVDGSNHQAWTVATAMRLKDDREITLKGKGFLPKGKHQAPDDHMVNKDYVLDMDRRACLSTQRNMFPDREYLLLNMFAVHPNLRSGFTVAAQLLDAVFEVAVAQNLPILVPGGGEAMQGLFQGCYGFQEKGAVAHFQHVPHYFWKFWFWKPGMRTTPKTAEEKEEERESELRKLAGC